MSKTFRYTKFTGHYYCMASDEWEEDGVEFDYQVEDKRLLPEIVDLLFDDYFSDDKAFVQDKQRVKEFKENLKRLIDEKDLVGWFADYYEDTLKEIFQDEAIEWYND